MPQPDVGKHGKLEDFGGQIMADRWILYILDRVGDMSSDLLQSMEGSSASLLVYQCSPAIATSFTGGNTVFLEACGIKVVHGTDFLGVASVAKPIKTMPPGFTPLVI
jgi:hypothetical protein